MLALSYASLLFQSPGPSQAPTIIITTHFGFLTVFQSPGPSQAPTICNFPINVDNIFQSPGPSQAPTRLSPEYRPTETISIPRALAGPDPRLRRHSTDSHSYFNPQGPRRPRRFYTAKNANQQIISIPRALAGPDIPAAPMSPTIRDFNPQGPRRPRHQRNVCYDIHLCISIPRALAGPDWRHMPRSTARAIFQSPGPSQAPTRLPVCWIRICKGFQSPGPSQAPTGGTCQEVQPGLYFNPQGPRRPRQQSSPIFLLTPPFFSTKRQFPLRHPSLLPLSS